MLTEVLQKVQIVKKGFLPRYSHWCPHLWHFIETPSAEFCLLVSMLKFPGAKTFNLFACVPYWISLATE